MNSVGIFIEKFSIRDYERLSKVYGLMMQNPPNIRKIERRCEKIKREGLFEISDPVRNMTGIDIVIDRDDAKLAKFMVEKHDVDPKKFLLSEKNVLSYIISKGVDVDSRVDLDGNTPLHTASAACTVLLIRAGANPDVENIFQASPLVTALLSCDFGSVRILFTASSPETRKKAMRFICYTSNDFPGGHSVGWLLRKGIFPCDEIIYLAIINNKRIIVEEFLDHGLNLQAAIDHFNKHDKEKCMNQKDLNYVDYLTEINQIYEFTKKENGKEFV